MKTLLISYLAVFSAWAVYMVNADMARKKIPNSGILLGMKLLAIALGLLLLNSYYGTQGRSDSFLKWEFYPMWALHVFWAVLSGLLLWHAEVWPAGDAKFFMLAASWLPLINPYLKNFPDRLFISFLVNIFVAAALVAVGKFIASGLVLASPAEFFSDVMKNAKKRIAEISAGGRNGWFFGAYVANMTFVFLLQQVLALETKQVLSGFLSRVELLYFFLFFAWDKIGRNFNSKKWLYATMICYVVYFFAGYFYFYDRLITLLLYSLGHVVKFNLILFFGRFVLGFLMEKKDTAGVRPAELEPGMILSVRTMESLRANPVFEGAFDDCFKDGLNAEQITALKEWLPRLDVKDPKIEIVAGRPFAVWIFAGAVITLVLDRTITGIFK